MRILLFLALLALVVPLAGCTQLDPGKGGKFTPTCPSWVKGLSTNVFQEAFQNSSIPDQKFDPAHPVGAGLQKFQEHPLDLIDLDFHPTHGGQVQAIGVANATLELRVFRSDGHGGVGDQLLLHDAGGGPNTERKDTWTWGAGIYKNFTLQVELSDPHAAPQPDPILLRWDFMPDTNQRTPSEAVMLYTAYFWYRTCSSDGTTL